MTVDDWKALVAELVAIFDTYDDESNLAGVYDDMKVNGNTVLERARIALADPKPEGPTDEELMVAFDGEFAEFFDSSDGFGTTAIPRSEWIKVARAVLARWGTSSGATLESGDKSTTQSKGLNRQEMKTFACEWWNKFGFVKDKATCTWAIDEIGPDHFVDFMFDVLAKYGNDTQPTEES